MNFFTSAALDILLPLLGPLFAVVVLFSGGVGEPFPGMLITGLVVVLVHQFAAGFAAGSHVFHSRIAHIDDVDDDEPAERCALLAKAADALMRIHEKLTYTAFRNALRRHRRDLVVLMSVFPMFVCGIYAWPAMRSWFALSATVLVLSPVVLSLFHTQSTASTSFWRQSVISSTAWPARPEIGTYTSARRFRGTSAPV